MVDLRQLQWEAELIFEPEVKNYIKNLIKHGTKLHEWREQVLGPNVKGEAGRGKSAEMPWFRDQYETVVQVFGEEVRLPTDEQEGALCQAALKRTLGRHSN